MNTKPVVVGIDGSADSRRALVWAAEYGHRYGAPVHTLAVWETPPTYGYPVSFSDEDYAGLAARTRAMLADTVRAGLGENARVVERVLHGSPASALAAASKTAKLLVVGSQGRGAFTGMLLGSVSGHCVHQAACPVVVMPAQSRDITGI